MVLSPSCVGLSKNLLNVTPHVEIDAKPIFTKLPLIVSLNYNLLKKKSKKKRDWTKNGQVGKRLRVPCKWVQNLRRERSARGSHTQVSECGRIATYEVEGVKWGPPETPGFLIINKNKI